MGKAGKDFKLSTIVGFRCLFPCIEKKKTGKKKKKKKKKKKFFFFFLGGLFCLEWKLNEVNSLMQTDLVLSLDGFSEQSGANRKFIPHFLVGEENMLLWYLLLWSRKWSRGFTSSRLIRTSQECVVCVMCPSRGKKRKGRAALRLRSTNFPHKTIFFLN